MKKRFFSIMLVLMLSLFFVGCGNYADMYSLSKDVKVKDETTAVELEDLQKEYAKNLEAVKVMSAIITIKVDTGEIKLLGQSMREVMNITMELVMDNKDEANPKISCIVKGNSDSYENGEKKETAETEISQYVKDGFVYNYNYLETTTVVDGKPKTETYEEKTKTKFDGELGFGGVEVPGPSETQPDIPTDMQEVIDMMNDIVNELKKVPNAEIGKDGKGNLVLQTVNTDVDGNRKCTKRVVFADGLLVFIGMNLGEMVKMGDAIMEVGINCNKGSVKYPNFSDYKEITTK